MNGQNLAAPPGWPQDREFTQLDKAYIDNDWETYLFLHSRQDRPEALAYIEDEMSAENFSRMIAAVWIEEEFPWTGLELWKGLWSNPDLDPQFVMTAEERKLLASLPATVEVYRGCQHREGTKGLSWTLSKEKALWFANRFRKTGKLGYLVTGRVSRRAILAVLLGRGEQEVVSLRVKQVRVDELPGDSFIRDPNGRSIGDLLNAASL